VAVEELELLRKKIRKHSSADIWVLASAERGICIHIHIYKVIFIGRPRQSYKRVRDGYHKVR
jgi:hypothetical protein